MKRPVKITLASLLAIVAILFANGCYFVFWHQDKAMNKILQGKGLNLYECCSVYTMHMALWLFGWPLSPEAARECFLLHFPHEDDDVVRFRASKGFMKSPKLQDAVEYLSDKHAGTSVRVEWKASRDYAVHSPEHRAAIAVNACDVIKGEEDKSTGNYEILIRCAMVYPKYSWTEFNLGKFSIYLHEGLFRYLEDRGWISRYIAEYSTVIKKTINSLVCALTDDCANLEGECRSFT